VTRRPARLGFDAINIEGGLLTPDFLATIAELRAPRQTPADYRVPRGIQVRDEIGRAWRIALAHWQDVESAVAAGGSVIVPMTAILRDAFGWTTLTTTTASRIVAERAFPISASALDDTVPLVLASGGTDLDKPLLNFGDGHKRRSAFGLLQEYLNATASALWGVTTNGLALRITRDNASLTRPAWIEADIARIMREERYADFSALWLLLNESRFGAAGVPLQECPLEAWRAASASAGTAARERLRDGVEVAIRELGNGFLKHPGNGALRERLQSGTLDPVGYQQQLLRLVYRLIFLLVAEERGLLHRETSDSTARDIYRDGYSLGRLRDRAARLRAYDRHEDVWAGLQVVLRACALGEPRLAVPALGGLFAAHQTPDLDAARIGNRFLLAAIYHLTWLENRDTLVRVNWRDMGTEELGSVYESLLELVPMVRDDARHFGFVGDAVPGEEGGDRPVRGHARRLTGSYYTPDSLVQALLDTALDPVAQCAESSADPERALLSLAVLDPACGSGHFLLGAARRLASRVARVRSEGTPSPAAYRTALRDVITHCLYGVDKNAMAIELARMALWLEAIDPGRPLAFLDHHLVHGDALLGVLQPSLLEAGIPDEAYAALTGDEKGVVKELKKLNAAARKQLERERNGGQITLSFATDEWTRALAAVDAMPDSSLDEISEKETALRRVMETDANRSRFAQDEYVASFLLPKTAVTQAAIPTTGTLRDVAAGVNPPRAMVDAVTEMARTTPFLHWSVTFAPVMARGGFDCVIGNPPWGTLELEEREWFDSRDSEIANARHAAHRARLIEALEQSSPALYREYRRAVREYDVTSHFARASGRYPLCGRGRVNTYRVFAETTAKAIQKGGRAGLIVPTGIATGELAKDFFEWIVSDGRLVSLYDFENREALFPTVAPVEKFCLLTLRGDGAEKTVPEFVFFATRVEHLSDPDRRFQLTAADIARINPNTRTCPIFRSSTDADITRRVYARVPVLIRTTPDGDVSPWGAVYRQMFNMSGASGLFRTKEELEGDGFALQGNVFTQGPTRYVPLIEGKLFHLYNHRYNTYEGIQLDKRFQVKAPTNSMEGRWQDPHAVILPRYWVEESVARGRWMGERQWSITFRDVVRPESDRRVAVFAAMPFAAHGHKAPNLFLPTRSAATAALLLSVLSSLPYEYALRQKTSGGVSLFILAQTPVLEPERFNEPAPWLGAARLSDWILPRVVELCYTAWDMRPLAMDCGFDSPPFRWDEDRRYLLQRELDALYFHLYGFEEQEVDHAFGTFRILRDQEEARYGEYRCRALVLDIFRRMEIARAGGTDDHRARFQAETAIASGTRLR